MYMELSPVFLQSGQGQGYDIILKSNTQIRLPPRKIDMATIMASSTLQSKPITLDALPSLPQYEKDFR